MGSPIVLVVPSVPRATVRPVGVPAEPPPAVIPIQPVPVPRAYVLSVHMPLAG